MTLTVKITLVALNAFMNIIGGLAIAEIGIGAVAMLVMWNSVMAYLVADNHIRNRRKFTRLMNERATSNAPAEDSHNEVKAE